MSLFDALFYLILLVFIGVPTVQASGVVASQDGNRTHPSTSMLPVPGCQNSCGNLTFDYPFGIGSGCFRNPDFNLTCDDTVQPPRLFLHDSAMEVVGDIDAVAYGSTGNFRFTGFEVAFSRAISMTPGVKFYNMSVKARPFSLEYTTLNITGCDFDIYLFNEDTNTHGLLCTVTCPNEQITDTVARQYCNGTGCCQVDVTGPLSVVRAFQLQFVLHNETRLRSSLWDRINITTVYASVAWTIVDQPRCANSLSNRMTNYACVSRNSKCYDSYYSDVGYLCGCEVGYGGNPYIHNGCSRDKGYNPIQQKVNCRRSCGDIEVPFPFGLEEGCFARKLFQLNCTNAASSSLQFDGNQQVTYINISEGVVGIKYTSDIGSMVHVSYEPELYIGYGESYSVQWAVANLTCQEAKQNSSGYACVSTNSTCLGVNSTYDYIGYRCKCMSGFQGNPYILNGCHDIDECNTPGICKGVCQNTMGSYHCSECPDKTQYDTTTMQCTLRKRQNPLSGIVIGLSSGFGVLLLSLSTMCLVGRWKRGIQKQLRRKHFRKNQGLLLEQIISSDENASDKTTIFSLDELEKATNNFDPTRILGRGGHGMVYKGILSDQRVVAIKKSKVSEQGEISQFINEVAILSQINHRNIVKLFRCCLETEVPLLVYDFIPNGSLFEILKADQSSNSSLSWDDCLRISAETAGALYYLHSAASVSIFHRDVKSSNILLDGNYTTRVSDFGASRLVPIDQTHVVTNVQGTFGYLDPEYYHTGKLNEKSDVYSFGVVLVELLLRKEPIFTSESGLKQNLSNYFLWEMKMKPLAEIVDAQVLKEATGEEINDVASLAEICLRLRGEERPTMKQVEMTLQCVRSKRLKSCQVAPRNEDTQPLLTGQSQATHQSLTIGIDMVDRANVASKRNQNCYSLEQEIMSSTTLPR